MHCVHDVAPHLSNRTTLQINTHLVYLPIPMVIQASRFVDPEGELWQRLRSGISQPDFSPPPPATLGNSASRA